MSSKPAAEPRSSDWRDLLHSPERVKQYLSGEMTLRELEGVSPKEMIETASTGYTLLNQGRLDKALAIFRGLAALSPEVAWFHSAIGVTCLAQGDLEAALAALNRAVELGPADRSARVNRGEALLRRGDLAAAARDFQEVVSRGSLSADPLTLRAKMLAAAALAQLADKPVKPGAQR